MNAQSPLELAILLHYYCLPGDYPRLEGNDAVKRIIEKFVKAGLLVGWNGKDQKYEANRPALEVYVNALLSVPFPEQKWIIPANTLTPQP